MTWGKIIETEYNGYRFRSRLEARWAVFFDALGIHYEYEHEGYEIDFGNGDIERYLPDFWLPDYDLHAEVKGVTTRGEISKDDAERMSLMIDFAGPCSNGIIILGNIPDPIRAYTMDWAVWRWDDSNLEWGYIIGDIPNMADFQVIDYQSSPYSFAKKDDLLVTHAVHMDECPYNTVWQALQKARQARFEYGETPTKRRVTK